MGAKTETTTRTKALTGLLRLRVRRVIAFSLIGASGLFVLSYGWSQVQAAAREGDGRSVRVARATSPAQPVAAPEPTELPRRLDGVLVPKAAANLVPIAVMLDDNPAARPHAGLAKASVVYNSLVEGGATRLMAVFSPDAKFEQLGPVRSARQYYVDWLSEYNALYVHAGGSPEALAMLADFGLNDLNGIGSGARYCFRDTSSYAPHNLFTDHDKMAFAIRDYNLADVVPTYSTWRFKDDDVRAARGTFAELELRYSSDTYNVRYEYNPETNLYARFHGSDPHRDRTTGEQIMAKNVIVQVIPPIEAVGEKGRLTLAVTGQDKAFLFRDGLVVQGHWEKADRTDRTRFIAEDGTEMKLNRGQTWVEVIPDGHEFPFH